jgi:hypothetical protein
MTSTTSRGETMNIASGSRSLRAAAALLALAVAASACGAEDDGAPQGGPTETKSSELLSNVPYATSGHMLTVRSNTAGDAALFNGKAYFAYIRADYQIGMVVESNLGSGQSPTTYTIPTPFPYNPGYGTALLPLGNVLYLFYPSGPTLLMHWTTDGVNWNGPYPLISLTNGENFHTPPAAVAWDGIPIVYIADVNCCAASATILRQDNVNGLTASQYSIGDTRTTNRAAATVWKGALYLAWAGDSGQITMQHWTDSTGWSAQTIPTGKVGVPGLYPVASGALELVFRGPDAHIYSTLSMDGVSFGNAYRDAASTTNRAPIPFKNWYSSANWVFYVGVDGGLFTVPE